MAGVNREKREIAYETRSAVRRRAKDSVVNAPWCGAPKPHRMPPFGSSCLHKLGKRRGPSALCLGAGTGLPARPVSRFSISARRQVLPRRLLHYLLRYIPSLPLATCALVTIIPIVFLWALFGESVGCE